MVLESIRWIEGEMDGSSDEGIGNDVTAHVMTATSSSSSTTSTGSGTTL